MYENFLALRHFLFGLHAHIPNTNLSRLNTFDKTIFGYHKVEVLSNKGSTSFNNSGSELEGFEITLSCYQNFKKFPNKILYIKRQTSRVSRTLHLRRVFTLLFDSFFILVYLAFQQFPTLFGLIWMTEFLILVFTENRSKHIEVLFEAMKIWERATCIKFVKRTTESRYAIIFYGSSGYVTGKYLITWLHSFTIPAFVCILFHLWFR